MLLILQSKHFRSKISKSDLRTTEYETFALLGCYET
jgi:hypothetical protein